MEANIIDNEFLLQDRIQKIRSINDLYDLEHNAYISFSGGKDSTVLHHLVDEALPGNKIPRVYINTGIEYRDVVAFVERERERETIVVLRLSNRRKAYVLFWNNSAIRSNPKNIVYTLAFTKTPGKAKVL